MADDPVWLAKAKTLQAGRRIRTECCAQDRSMLVSNEERGYRAYCFRCGCRGFVPHGDFSIDQLRRRRDEFALMDERKPVRLPHDFTTEIPPNEAVWLYRASISAELARHYGFGYSGSLRRVVLPVYRDNALIGFTARSTINVKPKYIERMVSPSGSIFVSDPSVLLPDSGDCVRDAGYDLVLTEDILSAVRVGRIARRTVALLGTSANAEQLAAILKGVRRIAIWLDPDKAGRTAGHKLSRTLQLQGFSVQSIRTERDPKFYSNAEIRRILNGQT